MNTYIFLITFTSLLINGFINLEIYLSYEYIKEFEVIEVWMKQCKILFYILFRYMNINAQKGKHVNINKYKINECFYKL